MARWAVAALGICLIAFFLFGRAKEGDRQEDAQVQERGEQVAQEPAHTETASDELLEVASSLAVEDLQGERSPVQESNSVLRVHVFDESGAAVEGASVSWSVLEERPEGDSETVARAWIDGAAWSESDSGGLATFSNAPEAGGQEPLVLWATHPEFFAGALVLDPDWNEGGRLFEIQLGAAPPLVAEVTKGEGAAPQGTRVVQLGMGLGDLRAMDRGNPWFRTGTAGEVGSDLLLRSFCREYECDEDGSAVIARGAMPTQVLAVQEDECSGPQTTVVQDPVVHLKLTGAFAAGGRVQSPGTDALPEDARVACRWESELSGQEFGEFGVHPDGTWGPVRLPLRSAGSYVFRLLGGGYIPEEKRVDVAAVRSPLRVDFEGVYGKTQAILVKDHEGLGVGGARVEAIWQVEGTWQRSRGWTDRDGRADLRGCPNATAWVRIHKAGYVVVNEGGILLVQPYAEEFVLESAGMVQGRVMHLGEPVENFQVFTWTGSPFERLVHPFSNRSDGQFELDGMAFGELNLIASSPDFPAGEAVRVEIDGDGPKEVEFDLPQGSRGIGRVLDTLSGEPIAGSKVEVVTMFSGRPLGGRGKQVATDSSGRFEVTGVLPGHAWINATAPGRVLASSGGREGPGGEVDFGTLFLSERQTLRVSVDSPRPLESREVWFGSTGALGIPLIHMPPDGQITVPEVAPGEHALLLVFNDGGFISNTVRLRPGSEWAVHFDYHPELYLDVRVIPEEGDSLPAIVSLHAQFRSSSGEEITRTNPFDPGQMPVRIDHIPSGEVLLSVSSDGWSNRLGSRVIQVGSDRSEVVELQLGTRSLAVTGVDSRGDVLDQGVVMLDSAVPGGLFSEAASLPPVAPYNYKAVPVDNLLVTIRHSTLGLGFEFVEMAPQGVTAVEVKVGGTPMNIRVSEAGAGVAGIDVRLIPQGVTTHGFGGTTGDDGRWTYLGIPPRHYSILLKRYGYWPERHEVDFNGQELLSLGIRQLGDLELLVTNSGGVPVAGRGMTLRSIADGVTVQEWLDGGQLSSSAVSLVTDGQGVCHVKGVPNGAYRWELVAADGSPVAGDCIVPRGDVGDVRVLLPE